MNIGEIDVLAKISGEVYLNNNLIDTIESDETLIKIGKTETLTAYFKPTGDGLYLVKGNIVYEGKKEPMDDISINVGSQVVETTNLGNSISGMFVLDTQSLVIIVFVVFALGLITIGIFNKRFKKSIKRK